MIRPTLIASILAIPVLAGCAQAVKAPTETGVCREVCTELACAKLATWTFSGSYAGHAGSPA